MIPQLPLTDDRLRVVVGEGQPLMRAGIVGVLQDGGIAVVAAAGNAEDLARKARAYLPDVVVTDIRMPPTMSDDGLRAARALRAERPGLGLVVLSQVLDGQYVLDLIGDRAGGIGYLLKDRVGDVAALVDAVRRVARGGSVLDSDVVQSMVAPIRAHDPLEALTPREREVLALMAEGRSNRGIAEILVVTVPAVERHVTNIFGKLVVKSAPEDHRRVLAVLEYLRAS